MTPRTPWPPPRSTTEPETRLWSLMDLSDWLVAEAERAGCVDELAKYLRARLGGAGVES